MTVLVQIPLTASGDAIMGFEIRKRAFVGSREEGVAFLLSDKLSRAQKEFVAGTLQDSDCGSSIFKIRWPAECTLVVEVFRKTILGSCSRVDVERAVIRILPNIPE